MSTEAIGVVKSKNGFTILEVLIAAGLMSILAMGTVGMMTALEKSQKRMEIKNSALDKNGLIQAALQDPNLCSSLMATDASNTLINLAGATVPQDFTLHHLQIVRGGTRQVLMTAGQPIDGSNELKATSIVFNLANNIGAIDATHTQYSGNLTISYAFVRDKMAPMKPTTFGLLVTVDASGAITGCNGSSAMLTESSICSELFGGTYSVGGTPPHCQNIGGTTNIDTSGVTVSSNGIHITGASNFQNDLTVTGLTTLGAVQATTGNFSGLLSAVNLSGTGNSSGFNQMSANEFITPSDRRLKENIKPLAPQTSGLNLIKTYKYNYISDAKKQKHIGIIAQEVRKIYPEIVVQNEDGKLAVSYQELIPILIKSLQETNHRLEILERKQNEK